MKLVTYRESIEAPARLGVIVDDLVVDVEALGEIYGEELPDSMLGLIDAGRPVGIGIGTVIAMVCTGRVIAAFNHFAKKKIEEITIA